MSTQAKLRYTLKMSLRLKVGVYVVGLVGGLLALTGYVQVRGERAIYLEQILTRNTALLKALAIPCAIGIANNEDTALDNYVTQFGEAADSMDLRELAILAYDGRVLAHTSPGEFGKIYADPFTLRSRNSKEPIHLLDEEAGRLDIAVPVESAGLRWGTLRASFTLAGVEHALTQSRARIVWMSAGISLGLGVIAYLVLHFLWVQPVMRMEIMARRVGRGDLSARVEVESRDELGRLALQLNSMAQQIATYTESLEGLVQARTAELAHTNAKLVEANRQLDRLAKTDALTGLYNRRYFMEQLEFEIRRGSRARRQFTLAMIDVDHFKHYNDTNGHTAGDELLQRLAALLEVNLRSSDLVARYGGEEFIVLFYDTGPEEGFATALKLQQVVAAQPFPFDAAQPHGKVTMSVGVAFYPDDSRDARQLIERADQALYQSKARGRNRVTRWTDVAAA